MATKESQSEVQSGFVDNWQNGKSVIESLKYSLEEHVLCDVTFIVGENRKRIQAHRLILSLRSCVFLAMLTGPLAEQDDIEIPDIDPDDFNQILKFLYTDDVSIDGSNVIALLYASKKYDIADLKKNCVTYMESTLSSHDVCLVMEQAHLYNELDLKEKCLTYSWQNGDAVLKSDSFLNLCHDCFLKVIEADQLTASEESVFEASISWSEAECKRQGRQITSETRRSALGEGIYLTRYSILDQDYFDERVTPMNLLTDSEENKILRCFLYPGKDASPFNSKHRCGTVMKPIAICRFKNDKHVDFNRGGSVDEGIVFCVNKRAKLQGFQIYGSSASTTQRFDIVTFICDVCNDNLLPEASLSTTIESTTKTCNIQFESPIQLEQDTRYKLNVRIKGKGQFHGINGTAVVQHGSFRCQFLDAKKFQHSGESGNDTCVETGQIPSLVFLV